MSTRLRTIATLGTTFGLTLAVAGLAVAADAPWDQQRRYVFAQSAHGFRFDGTKLSLESVAATLYFGDGSFGQVDNQDFVKHWSQGADSFAANTP